MCQVDEEYNGQLEQREGPSVSKKCVKCKEATAALVIRAGDAFCRGCFKDYFIHKFRAMLGKNRVIFPGEKVLLAVSGGPASCSMLNQVQEGLSCFAPKKLRFTPGIVYIDEGGAIGLSMEERQRTVAEVESVFRATGFPFHIVPLEQVLNLPSSVLEPAASSRSDRQTGVLEPAASSRADRQTAETNYKSAVDLFIQTSTSLNPENQADLSGLNIQEGGPTPLVIDETLTQSLQRLFGSVKTLTAREDLLHTLRQHLLVHTARCEGYSKVMLGESCTRLAVKLLANIALGRGAQLAMDTGFSDPRYGDVVIVRPMRDYSAKEISFYNHMFNISSVFIPSLDTKTPDKGSIQRLTESFVIKLQADFPSTVSTIYRTSEKLQTACPSQTSSAEHSHKCLLCMCALDTTVEELSAFQATLMSEQLSQRRVLSPGSTSAVTLTPDPGPATSTSVARGQCCSSGGEQGGGESCGGGCGGGCCSTVKSPETVELKSLLCYSCRLTIKDMASVEVLPEYILSEAQKRERRSQMRGEISEFLLNEDEEEEAKPS